MTNIITTTSAWIAILVLTEKITDQEANHLATELSGTKIPTTWLGVVLQIEEIIGRKLI